MRNTQVFPPDPGYLIGEVYNSGEVIGELVR